VVVILLFLATVTEVSGTSADAGALQSPTNTVTKGTPAVGSYPNVPLTTTQGTRIKVAASKRGKVPSSHKRKPKRTAPSKKSNRVRPAVAIGPKKNNRPAVTIGPKSSKQSGGAPLTPIAAAPSIAPAPITGDSVNVVNTPDGNLTLNFTPFSQLPQESQDKFNKNCGYCFSSEAKVQPQWDANLSPARRRILSTAVQYIRSVSDCGGQGKDKFGADTLVQIYKDSFQGKFSATFVPFLREASSKWRNGPWSWCGIWAVAAVRASGITDLQWGIGKIDGRKPIWGSKGVQPGDIAFWKGALNHHNIIEAIDGDIVYTIDGNQMCSSIQRKKRKLSEIGGYYNIAP